MIREKLRRMGDCFTAGFLDGGLLGALTEQLVHGALPPYTNTHLYPLSPIWGSGILGYSYSYSVILDETLLQKSLLTPAEKAQIRNSFDAVYKGGSCIDEKYALAGRGYTHFCPELEAVIKSSLPDYLRAFRAEDMLDGRLDALCDAVVCYVQRLIDYLQTFPTPRAQRLAQAYCNMLCAEAGTFFDAFVRVLFIFALDGFDSLGGVDVILGRFTACDEAKEMFAELYRAYERNNAWNFSLGDDCKISALALSAFDGASRPNFSIKVDENTPQYLWDACFEAMQKGCRPAFYSKKAFEEALQDYGVEQAHLRRICYGGCSETMVAGLSNVGSIDGGINLAQILCDILREADYATYDALVQKYFGRIEQELDTLMTQCNEEMLAMAACPQYIRTLLCPPCAESKKEFQGGGARYYFSVINLCALANAADSLYAIKTLVFEQKRFSLAQVTEAMDRDFSGGEYEAQLQKLEFFGNDNPEVDRIAASVFACACDKLRSRRTAYKQGAFLPACILFDTAIPTGRNTSATPDGRERGMPIADSGGAMTGRDHTSPTALLNSVSAIDPRRAAGSWIVNLALSKDLLAGQNDRTAFRALVLCYFSGGGNQLQVNVLDRKTLLQAVDDDGLAASIIVRVGGFSERFSNLTREFRLAIASRTQY